MSEGSESLTQSQSNMSEEENNCKEDYADHGDNNTSTENLSLTMVEAMKATRDENNASKLDEAVRTKAVTFVRGVSNAGTEISNGPSLEDFDGSEKLEQLINPTESSARQRSYTEDSAMSDPVSPTKSLFSHQTSFKRFAHPEQTLLYVDWDDTLFPTTALFDEWGIQMRRGVQQGSWRRPFTPPLTKEQHHQLEFWQDAAQRFLCVASECATCVIVTNAKPGWVETCVQTFAPRLKDYFQEYAPKVVYAQEVLSDMTKRKKVRKSELRPVKHCAEDDFTSARQHHEKMMAAKFEAMRSEADAFYSRYPGQSWKNILSFGDQPYEREALQELGMRRVASKPERLRIKTVLLPDSTSVGAMGPRLETLRMLLPAIVKYNEDLDIDLQNSAAPFETLSKDLDLPKLKEVSSVACLWDEAPTPSNTSSFEDAIQELSEALMEI